jgi:hypothetical protein
MGRQNENVCSHQQAQSPTANPYVNKEHKTFSALEATKDWIRETYIYN